MGAFTPHLVAHKAVSLRGCNDASMASEIVKHFEGFLINYDRLGGSMKAILTSVDEC